MRSPKEHPIFLSDEADQAIRRHRIRTLRERTIQLRERALLLQEHATQLRKRIQGIFEHSPLSQRRNLL